MILKSCRSLTMIFFLGMDVWMNNIELNSTISPGLIWPKPTATEARLVARLEANRQEMAETRDMLVVLLLLLLLLCCVPELGLDCGCGERTSADIMGEWWRCTGHCTPAEQPGISDIP